MKEGRQNDREIGVMDDYITENTDARSPLTLRNLRYVVACSPVHKLLGNFSATFRQLFGNFRLFRQLSAC